MRALKIHLISLVITFIIFTIQCYGQDSVFYYNDKPNIKIETVKKKHIKSEYFLNQKLHSKGTVVFEIVTDSSSITETSPGKFKTTIYTKLIDQYDGDYTQWYENGKIECKGSYKNGLKFGTWSYYSQDDVLIKQENYSKEGYLTGAYTEYYSNGKVKIKGMYKTSHVPYPTNKSITHVVSMKDGNWEYYTSSGILESKETWKDNQLVNSTGSQSAP